MLGEKSKLTREKLYYCTRHYPKFNSEQSHIFAGRVFKASEKHKCLICGVTHWALEAYMSKKGEHNGK